MKKSKIERLRIHKQHLFIKAVAWLTILTFLITLLFLGFPIVCNADDGFLISDYFFCDELLSNNGLDKSGIYNTSISSNHSPYYDDTSQFDDIVKNIMNTSITEVNISDDNYPLYNMYILGNNDGSNIIVIFSDQSKILRYSTDTYLGWPSYASFYRYDYNNNDLDYIGTQIGNISDFNHVIFASGQVNFSGPGYTTSDINYLLLDNKMGRGPGGYNVPDANSDSIKNHQKLYNGSTMYLSTSNLNNGALHIIAKSDDVQKKQGKVKLTVSVSTTVKHNSTFHYRLSASNGLFSDNYNVPDNNFNIGTYASYEIPLSEFDSNGNYSIDLNTLNTGLWNNNEKTLEDFNQNFQDQSTYAKKTITSVFFYLLTIGNASWDYSQLDDFDYSLLSEVYDCQASLIMGEHEEPIKGFQYEMVSGSLTEQDYDLPDEDSVKDALDTNIVPNDYTPTPQKPKYPDAYNITVPNSNTDIDTNNDSSSSSDNNVTVSGGDNSVINNVTITQNDKYPQKGVMTSFLKIINQDKNDAVKYIGETSGINGYLYLLQTSMSWIPQEVWTVWIKYLQAILGICVGAFFLKILINWST